MTTEKRIAILTSGGDCPGLNAAIRAATKAALQSGYEVLGIRNGWDGMLQDQHMVLDSLSVSRIIDRGGTVLGTSRTSPFYVDKGPELVLEAFKRLSLQALIVLGGDGTLSATERLFKLGLPVVGIPKTIDNDVRETDFAIGFQTAVQIATEALDRLRTTAESHHRIMLLEVMGNTAGWIAVYAGMAAGADAILIPEIPLDKDRVHALCEMVKSRKQRGKNYSLIVVAEGARLVQPYPEALEIETSTPHLDGISTIIGKLIQKETGIETRVSSLGYIQRGGSPLAFDRNLATSFGVKALELIEKQAYGEMAAIQGNVITSVPLSKVVGGIKPVDLSAYKTAEIFFS